MEDNLARYEVQVADGKGWRTVGFASLKSEAEKLVAAYRGKRWVRATRIIELETV